MVAGAVLVVLGLILLVTGYGDLQQTTLEKAATLLGQFSGQPAPPAVYSPKTTGYVVAAAGALSLIAGLAFILKSRASAKGPTP